jgi:sigma-B regulation protein RsbU (phosphoserine phosphatase)
VTIRVRLIATQAVLGATVIALCVLAIGAARMADELAQMPALHVNWFRHIHELADGAGQAIRELEDLIQGEETAAELAEPIGRVRDALVAIRGDASDPDGRAAVRDLEVAFAELERGQAEVVALALAGDATRARARMILLGELTYEKRFRTALDGVEAHAVACTTAVREQGAARSRRSLLLASALVLLGVLVTAIGTVIVVRIQRRLTALSVTAADIAADVHHARSRDVVARDELGELGRSFNRMADDVARLIDTTAAKEALTAELALAARMQQSLLPSAPQVPGLEIAGAMSTVTQVGGDYYDVLPTRDGAWIAIGDVSGHGFNTGVVTLLAQSAIHSVTRALPDAAPGELLPMVNDVLHDLVRIRLGLRDHMTLTLLRYRDDGSVEFAGAHQEIIVRAADGSSRTIETSGPWLAVVPDIAEHLVSGRFELAAGETIVLFTDGVVEARAAAGDMFGLDRLLDTLAALPRDASARAVRDAVFARVHAMAPTLDDDATLLAIRRLAAAADDDLTVRRAG